MDISYRSLPDVFYQKLPPTNLSFGQTLENNERLLSFLGTTEDELKSYAEGETLALAYGGHQFGHPVPLLGDGRASLICQLKGQDGELYDVQVKGYGTTPYSRRGDGLYPLGSALKEHLLSEFLADRGISTSRSALVIESPYTAHRLNPEPAVYLFRVARTHIRFGTFELASRFEDSDILRALVEFCAREYFQIPGSEFSATLQNMFEMVCLKTRQLINDWLDIGFVHGVMNTDNMSVIGETLDFGPCAFVDDLDPGACFSSIDRGSRYAYGQQGKVAQWNLRLLAEVLATVGEGIPLEFWTRTLEETAANMQQGKHIPSGCSAKAGQDFPTVYRSVEDCLATTGLHERQKNLRFYPRNHLVRSAIEQYEGGNPEMYRDLYYRAQNTADPDLAELGFELPDAQQKHHVTFCGT